MIIIIILQEVIVGINILKNNIKDHSKPDIFNEKNFVFIISAGRTGTKFLGDKLSEIIENSYSVHEPDVLNDDFKNIINKIYQFGIYQMIIGKFLNKTGIRNLSQNYISRKININQLVTQLINHREKFYKKINSNLIIESYSGWYGVIPGIQKLYKYYKIIIIIRDPREWIRSTINWQNIYGKKDFVQKLSFLKLERLNPEMTQDMNYSMDWKEYSKFEKLCWMYNSLYSIMLSEAKNDQNIEVVSEQYISNIILQEICYIMKDMLIKNIKNNYDINSASSMSPGTLKDWKLSERDKLLQLFKGDEKRIGVKTLNDNLISPIISVYGIVFEDLNDYNNCRLCPKENCPNRSADFVGFL